MRFDLHIHSNYSHDSSLSVDEILGQAMKKKLDGIAVCDHDTVEGSLLAIKRAKELALPLLVLPGIEISTEKGHLLVLGIRENIPQGRATQDAVSIARQKGGIVIAAHPFKGRSTCVELDVDAIETFNSRCIFGENTKAKRAAIALKKPQVGGSDSHLLATIGLGFTDIDAEPDEESVLKAIREGRTIPGGHIVPLYLIFIMVLRKFFRKLHRLLK